MYLVKINDNNNNNTSTQMDIEMIDTVTDNKHDKHDSFASVRSQTKY